MNQSPVFISTSVNGVNTGVLISYDSKQVKETAVRMLGMVKI